ncbi:NTP/NDP exchange transporter [Steroidobacter sp.]|uniref:NTP/NDP exchange transporter n=1 Tax=Steroidobacter sp. TaxID=1978227 RepID=UPI001A50E4AA|nr:MFS transporter [Steroidobacter sp.]MBL8269979.1 MFS transporter [Steroidobacter sp.]
MNSPASAHTSPFARLLSRLAPIQPAEMAAVTAAFFLFFFMWSGYFAVRPVRETIGTLIGRDKLADIWIVTSIVSVLIIPIYGWVVAHVRRSVFLPWAYGIVAVVLVITGVLFQGEAITLGAGKFFYVFISVVNLFLLSVFWSFLLELFDRGQTKRLFGVIAAGGSAGALVGPFISDLAVPFIGNSGVLFFGAGLFVAAIFCQRVLLGVRSGRTEVSNQADDRPIGGNPFAGVTLILKSPYVLGIALFVVFISCVNTLLYFEQLRLVEEHFPALADRTQIFARFDWIVQALTVLSQVFLTGRIADKFGVKVLVTFVPVIMIFAFGALALSGTFAVLTAVVIARRAMEYAFVRPGREMLWSPLDKETKYKAKTTVDVPVYRGADALSAQLNNFVAGIGFGIGAVAWLGAGVAALWAMLGWWLGRRFEDHEKLQSPRAPAAQR